MQQDEERLDVEADDSRPVFDDDDEDEDDEEEEDEDEAEGEELLDTDSVPESNKETTGGNDDIKELYIEM